MKWEVVLLTFAFMVLGYLIGSISNAVLVTKILKLEDVRKKGSGNAGATNTLRNYGKKIGLVVFILDIIKPIIAMLLALPLRERVFIPAIGLSAVIGHIWPIFFNFKGGKGAASFLGFMISLNWIVALIGFFIFVFIVKKWKMVSLGSIVTPIFLIIIYISFAFIPNMRGNWVEPLMNVYDWWMNTIIFVAIWLLVVFKHKDNIKRIINGSESKLGSSKNKTM